MDGRADSSPSERDGDEGDADAGLEIGLAGYDEALAELQGLIGLEPVKEAVRSYVNVVKIQQQRRAAGLKAMSRSNHLCSSVRRVPARDRGRLARWTSRSACSSTVR